MKMTEKREFYWLQVIVSAATVNLDNVNIKFDGITLYSEDEEKEITISGRRNIVQTERCSEGLKVDVFILNEGDKIEDRIDYLIDEDYEITDVKITVSNKKTGKELPTRYNDRIGEQVVKEVPVELDPKLEETSSYVLDMLSEGNQELSNLIFDTIKSNTSLQDIISKIIEIDF